MASVGFWHEGTPPARSASEADIGIWHSNRGEWKFELLSPRARQWARGNLNLDQCRTRGDVFRTDLSGINSLIQRGRTVGLSSQYLTSRDSER